MKPLVANILVAHSSMRKGDQNKALGEFLDRLFRMNRLLKVKKEY